MTRSDLIVVSLFGLGACGPTAPVQPGDDSDTGDGSSVGPGSEGSGAVTATSSTGSVDPGTTSASDDTASSSSDGGDESTGVVPPEVEGDWVCTGFEDPFFLRLQIADDGVVKGTICTPLDAQGDPPDWSPCAPLLEHFNVAQTTIYFAAQIEHELYPMGVLTIEAGLEYLPKTDLLVGVLWAGATFEETCERY